MRQDGGVGWGGHGQTQKRRIGFVILTTHGGKKVESNIRNGAQVQATSTSARFTNSL